LIIQSVNFVIMVADRRGGDNVPIDERIEAVSQHVSSFFCHARDVDKRLQRRLVAHQEAYLRDPLGIIANPLKFNRYMQRCDEDSQVTSQGPLSAYQVDTQFLQIKAFPDDNIIVLHNVG
jgi:hypothetical protein